MTHYILITKMFRKIADVSAALVSKFSADTEYGGLIIPLCILFVVAALMFAFYFMFYSTGRGEGSRPSSATRPYQGPEEPVRGGHDSLSDVLSGPQSSPPQFVNPSLFHSSYHFKKDMGTAVPAQSVLIEEALEKFERQINLVNSAGFFTRVKNFLFPSPEFDINFLRSCVAAIKDYRRILSIEYIEARQVDLVHRYYETEDPLSENESIVRLSSVRAELFEARYEDNLNERATVIASLDFSWEISEDYPRQVTTVVFDADWGMGTWFSKVIALSNNYRKLRGAIPSFVPWSLESPDRSLDISFSNTMGYCALLKRDLAGIFSFTESLRGPGYPNMPRMDYTFLVKYYNYQSDLILDADTCPRVDSDRIFGAVCPGTARFTLSDFLVLMGECDRTRIDIRKCLRESEGLDSDSVSELRRTANESMILWLTAHKQLLEYNRRVAPYIVDTARDGFPKLKLMDIALGRRLAVRNGYTVSSNEDAQTTSLESEVLETTPFQLFTPSEGLELGVVDGLLQFIRAVGSAIKELF